MAPGSQNRMNSNKERLKMKSGAQRMNRGRMDRVVTWGGRFSGILRKIFLKNGVVRASLDSIHH